MTAEIAILNSYGIALAADSAVTIGNQKVYNGADKLFALSKYEPIAIMVYNGAALMGIPWETIIKQYRMALGRTAFPTLKEYANRFWEFLTETDYVIPQNSKSTYVHSLTNWYLQTVRLAVEKSVKEKFDTTGGQITPAETIALLRSTLEEISRPVLESDFIFGFDQTDIDNTLISNRAFFEETTKKELGELFLELSELEKSAIYTTIANLFVRDYFSPFTSGLVFAGYGTKEMFPKIASYIVEGIANNKVKKALLNNQSNVDQEGFAASIIPFAQDDMVWTFINGVDPNISKFANSYLEKVFSDYPQVLGNTSVNIGPAILDELRLRLQNVSEGLLAQFRTDVKEYQDKIHRQPILEMVSGLPKDELAAMAESLVNLTAFKRKISKTMETVGGPIDVAVISKGDGFIWVKRKHYFRPELNQRFFSNYFHEDKA